MTAAAKLPTWLRERLTGTRCSNGRRTAPEEWVRLVREGAAEGQRNDSLARLVGHLLRRDVNVDLVAEVANLVNDYRFKPPLGREEVDRVVDSIAAAEMRRRA